VINESAAAGMAIVATRVVGAAPELVRDGVNGRIVPPGDPGAMAAALRDATDPATLRRMRAASAQVLEQWRSAGDPVAGLRRALGRAAPGAGAPAPAANGRVVAR
jgi:glycosyltransferase involved in cell wall biosynthesis